MKKNRKMIGIIIMVMIIGLLAVGCENPSGGGKDKDDDKDDVVMYTVTFNSNGGTDVDAIQVESGNTITLPAEPTKAGYNTFNGWYTDNNTFADAFTSSTAVSSDITVYAKWTAIGLTGPAGGIIFYEKDSVSDGWQYLEAAPASAEFSATWGPGSLPAENKRPYGTAVGTGKDNTDLIVEYLSSLSETGRAAQLCVALNVGGKTDWFLPSKDELNLMYTNLHVAGLGEFSASRYWSSTDYSWDAYLALTLDFSDGDETAGDKTSYVGLVRAIRQF